MTNHQRKIRDEQAALRGLALRMAGSAELAERAASRSLAVRCFVLLVLRWSEFVARRYLIQACRDYGLAVPAFALLTAFHLDFGTRADALRLAQDFRDLAEAFEALAACPPPVEHPFWQAMRALERLSRPQMAFRGSVASHSERASVGGCYLLHIGQTAKKRPIGLKLQSLREILAVLAA